MPFFFTTFRLARIPPPEPPPEVPEQDLGTLWMIIGDSQTEGRAPAGTSQNPGTAFRHIWNENVNDGADITTFTNLGQGGSTLNQSNSRYHLSSARTNRTWVHTQESGGQSGDGGSQITAAAFKAVFKDHILDIYANTPSAVISYETPFEFGRDVVSDPDYPYRDWSGAYETALREAITELYNENGITVYLAEVRRDIELLQNWTNGVITIVPADVWYQSGDPDWAHYTPMGNFMVALSMFVALGYNPTTFTFTSITDVTADQKTACVAVIAENI